MNTWLLTGGAAVTLCFILGGGATSLPAILTTEVHKLAQPVQPLGANAPQIVLPPRDETAVVRDLAKQISSHPRSAAWLATDGLIRTFVAVVADVADGRTPARHLPLLHLSSRFRVIERAGNLYVDARSYDRYDGFAAAAAAIDAAGCARLYGTLKPRIEEAYRDLGRVDTPFDRALERAIVVVLATPVLDTPVRVESQDTGFRFAVAELEALPAAQRQLLRTGPRNVRIIQSSLRAIARALGIPAQRLPAPRR